MKNKKSKSDQTKIAADRAKGIKFSKDGKTLLKYPADLPDETYDIPDGVTAIGDNAFESCDNLTEIHIPDGVTTIGKSAFSCCQSLVKVCIPDGVTSIGEKAFWLCSDLPEVNIPGSVTSIGEGAFMACYNLVVVHIPDSVTNIGKRAFMDCKLLDQVNIPGTVASISWVFLGCSSLTSVRIGDGVTRIGASAFESCRSLFEIHIPDSVTSIEQEAFKSCAKLSEVHIPDSVTSIGERAFKGCKELSEVHIPDSVTSIGESAFEGCENLKEVIVPRGCEIGEDAFPEDCRVKQRGDVKRAASAHPVREAGPRTDRQKLAADRAKGIKFSEDGKTLLKYPDDLQDETYEIPDGVECIAKNAFNSAMSLHHVTFPKSLKRIEKEAFISAGLREAVLPEGLEEIGAAAFWCSELTEVSIPRSVKEIGEYAFYGCSSLKKIVTFWDEPHGNVMALRICRGDSDSWQEGEAPASLFCNPRVFSGCKNLLDVTGCEAVKALVSEYQRRAANPLPEDDPECPRDYQFDDEW
ncbi:MAG: leucine-rich repeat domain-containing protein [Lentisphaeria bacterium]|nr:leucine-rich repeat domain-containing protein [Lentisphaeria bacterium]